MGMARTLAQTLAHAAVGCATAAGRGRIVPPGCGRGEASVLGNLVDAAGGFDKTSLANQALYTGGAALLGGLLTEAAGKDGLTGLPPLECGLEQLSGVMATGQGQPGNWRTAEAVWPASRKSRAAGWLSLYSRMPPISRHGFGRGPGVERDPPPSRTCRQRFRAFSVIWNWSPNCPPLMSGSSAILIGSIPPPFESAGMDGATAAGRYYVRLVALLAAVPAGVEGAVKLPSTLASLTEQAAAGDGEGTGGNRFRKTSLLIIGIAMAELPIRASR